MQGDQRRQDKWDKLFFFPDRLKTCGKKLLSSEGNRGRPCVNLASTLIYQPIKILFIQQLCPSPGFFIISPQLEQHDVPIEKLDSEMRPSGFISWLCGLRQVSET